MKDFLDAAEKELTEYNVALVRKYIDKIIIYEDYFKVYFEPGIDFDIE